MMHTSWVDELDAGAALTALEGVHRVRLEAEAQEFCLAAHWADLHNGDAVEGSGRLSPGMERSRQVGGHGTPMVGEFAAAELAVVLGVSAVSGRCLIRDALDVRHRHPRLWEAVMAGEARVWQARQVAQECHRAGLGLDQTLAVDAETTPLLGSLPWPRFCTVLEGRILAADPERAEERRRAAEADRFVATGRCNQFGLKTLIAKATAGDVLWLDAMCDRIAAMLAALGDEDTRQVRRSKALGLLGHPVKALALFAEYDEAVRTGRVDPTPTPAPDSSDTGAPDSPAGDDTLDADATGAPAADATGVPGADAAGPAADGAAERPAPAAAPTPAVGAAVGAAVGVAAGDPAPFVKLDLDRVDWRGLLPRITVYVHLSAESLSRDAAGVARIEGLGPVTLEQVREFLRDSRQPITVKPVIDLAGQRPADAYERSASMAEALHLRTPADVFPFGTSLSRRKDADHVRPYRPPCSGGPPGQTHLDNLAPMTRSHHRIKTHGGWQLRQPEPNVYLWRTPHGRHLRVDAHGTHPLPDAAGRAAWRAAEHPTPPHPEPASPLEAALATLIAAT